MSSPPWDPAIVLHFSHCFYNTISLGSGVHSLTTWTLWATPCAAYPSRPPWAPIPPPPGPSLCPTRASHYSSFNIIVEGSANKVDNIIQVGMKSLKKKTWIWQQPQHSSLAGAASLQSSKAYAVFPCSSANGRCKSIKYFAIFSSFSLKKIWCKGGRNSQHPSFLRSHQQASLIYLAQCTSRRF